MIFAGQKAKDPKKANQSLFPCNKGQKVNDTKPILSIVITPTNKGQKVDDAKFCTKDAIKKTYIGRIIRLSAKAKDVKKVLLNPQKTFLLE